MLRIRILNWERFQHYKGRNPPWIKLYNQLLNSFEYRSLSDQAKLTLLSLWMLRSKLAADIPNDDDYIRQMTGIRGLVETGPLLRYGFIEIVPDDSLPGPQPRQELPEPGDVRPVTVVPARRLLTAAVERFDEVEAMWNKHAPAGFKAKQSHVFANQTAFSRVIESTMLGRTVEEIKEAVVNYWTAAKAENTRTVMMQFGRFLAKMLETPGPDGPGFVYWPNVFSLENCIEGGGASRVSDILDHLEDE